MTFYDRFRKPFM